LPGVAAGKAPAGGRGREEGREAARARASAGGPVALVNPRTCVRVGACGRTGLYILACPSARAERLAAWQTMRMGKY